MSPGNSYDDAARAAAYARLEFPGTYYLAFRDLPDIIAANVTGRRALDFGCGAGRSTVFLRGLGFEVTGIDISPSMIERARKADASGSYQLIEDGNFSGLTSASGASGASSASSATALHHGRPQTLARMVPLVASVPLVTEARVATAANGFDLILSAFAFDNIPDVARRLRLLRGLRELLLPNGRIIVLGSTPEIYTHEWESFTTRQFAGNREARSGDAVQVVLKDVADQRPVIDYLWSHEDYLRLFSGAELELLDCRRPLGREDESQRWRTELSIPPWVIYVLGAIGS